MISTLKILAVTVLPLTLIPASAFAEVGKTKLVTCVEDLRASDGPRTELKLIPLNGRGYRVTLTKEGNSFGQKYSSEQVLILNTCRIAIGSEISATTCRVGDVGMAIGKKKYHELKIQKVEHGHSVDLKLIEIDWKNGINTGYVTDLERKETPVSTSFYPMECKVDFVNIEADGK